MISFSLPRTFGRMVGSTRQGLAIVAVMAVLAIGSQVTVIAYQNIHHGTVPVAVGAATEGTETRFGVFELRGVRVRDDVDLDRVGGLVPRLLHQPRRRRADGEHDVRRGRAGRHRLGPVRDAHPRGDHGVRRRVDDRANTGVPEEEDRQT